MFSPISRHDFGAKVSRNGNDPKSVTYAGHKQPGAKVSRNGNDPKSVTNAGHKQPFRCLDENLSIK